MPADSAVLPSTPSAPGARIEDDCDRTEEGATSRRPVLAVLTSLLERQPVPLLWAEAIGLSLLVGFFDYVTGPDVSVVLFYSLPILLMVRFAERKASIFMALVCALAWWWADEASGHHYDTVWHQIWESAVRLSYFLLFAKGGAAVKSQVALLEHSRRLEQEIIRISEREQRRIGQDLHDGLCQYFAAVAWSAGTVKSRLEKQHSPEVKAVIEIEKLLLEGVQQVRSLARGLFPVQSDAWGLHSALSELAASMRALRNLDCTFESNTTSSPLNGVSATHVFRIAQEAVSNAVKHGQARRAVISLNVSGDEVTLSVADDGVGYGAVLERAGGLGLGIMRHRARQLNGTILFSNNDDGGATVTCQVPVAVIAETAAAA